MEESSPGSATVVVTGSSGLIGTALTAALGASGHVVRRMVRRQSGPGDIRWNPADGEVPAGALEGVDAIVHLAGAGIGERRWTDSYKQTLVDSRVGSTELLARTVARLERPPRVLLSASAVGYYGDRGDEELDESSAAGSGFLAELCQRWEGATEPAAQAGVTTTLLRTGIVLTPRGGALAKQLPLFRLGLGAKIGSGRQFLSWITLDDHVAACERLISSAVPGPVNLTGPAPVRNAEFTATLAAAVRRWHLPGVPGVVPKLILGAERAEHLLLHSQRVHPTRLQQRGFTFTSPTLADALQRLIR